MARIPRCRRVEFYPKITSFKPAGLPRSSLEQVGLLVEELEAIRLKDQLGLEQEECSKRMRVSRPTFQRILVEARAKIADALINGKELHIEGGDYCLGVEAGPCRRQSRRADRSASCPFINKPDDAIPDDKASFDITSDKVAICSTGDQPSSMIDGRFGRCSHFIICDPQTGEYEILINHGSDMDQGAGAEAAQILLDKGVKMVIATRIGLKAFAVLEHAGAAVFSCQNNLDASSALKKLKDGELERLNEANNQ